MIGLLIGSSATPFDLNPPPSWQACSDNMLRMYRRPVGGLFRCFRRGRQGFSDLSKSRKNRRQTGKRCAWRRILGHQAADMPASRERILKSPKDLPAATWRRGSIRLAAGRGAGAGSKQGFRTALPVLPCGPAVWSIRSSDFVAACPFRRMRLWTRTRWRRLISIVFVRSWQNMRAARWDGQWSRR